MVILKRKNIIILDESICHKNIGNIVSSFNFYKKFLKN